MTLTSATHLYNHIKTFNLDKALHPKVEEIQFQGCEFNIHDGILGFVHPVIGWFMVATFNYDSKQDIIESIQWVLDEYGMNYTFQVIDLDGYSDSVWEGCSKVEKIFGIWIASSSYREEVKDLERQGIIRILSAEPRQ